MSSLISHNLAISIINKIILLVDGFSGGGSGVNKNNARHFTILIFSSTLGRITLIWLFLRSGKEGALILFLKDIYTSLFFSRIFLNANKAAFLT